ncbi:MAG TPA: hypothetical protein VGK73_39690 [Polyangiaceae bacterium]
MTDVAFDAYDLRHTLAAGFNTLSLLTSPEAMQRASARTPMREIREAIRDVLASTVETLMEHPLEGSPLYAEVILDIFGAANAAVERWTDDSEPPSEVVDRARECWRRSNDTQPPGGWGKYPPLDAAFLGRALGERAHREQAGEPESPGSSNGSQSHKRSTRV